MKALWRDCIHCQEERLAMTFSRAEAELIVAEAPTVVTGRATQKLYSTLRRMTGLFDRPKRKP